MNSAEVVLIDDDNVDMIQQENENSQSQESHIMSTTSQESTATLPTKSAKRYRTQNTQVERAMQLQEKQITLLETIVEQNKQIIAELQQLKRN